MRAAHLILAFGFCTTVGSTRPAVDARKKLNSLQIKMLRELSPTSTCSPHYQKKKKKKAQSIFDFICKHLGYPAAVENREFHNVVETKEPRYSAPSGNTSQTSLCPVCRKRSKCRNLETLPSPVRVSPTCDTRTPPGVWEGGRGCCNARGVAGGSHSHLNTALGKKKKKRVTCNVTHELRDRSRSANDVCATLASHGAPELSTVARDHSAVSRRVTAVFCRSGA